MKFRIKDEDGNQYIVEEDKRDDIIDSDEDIVEESVEAIEKVDDADETALTSDEITALKQLAAIAPKLMAMVNGEVTDADEDIEEDVESESTEEIIDTDETLEEEKDKELTTDSAKSFGSIEKRAKRSVDDSLNDDISAAWQKRLNGGLK